MYRRILILCSLVVPVCLGVVCVSLIAPSLAGKIFSLSEPERNILMRKIDEKCWFRSEEGLAAASWEKIKARQDRQMFGYDRDLPLNEAIAEFNNELSCSPTFASTPPLTEAEFIRTIESTLSSNVETAGRREDLLRSIILHKRLPKASLVYFGADGKDASGKRGPEKSELSLEIYLVLDLDPAHGHKATVPDQRILIRDSASRERAGSD